MSIANECMIVNISVSTWLGYRLDKEATRKVVQDASAHEDAARVNKHLVSKESLKPIIAAAGAARTHFYAKTLPWRDNGDRVLTRKMYRDFIEEHSNLERKFCDAVSHFINVDYPQERARAEFRMGDLFNYDDYPAPSEIERRFNMTLDMDAVTEANDFRMSINANEQQQIKDQIEAATQARLTRAIGDIWERLSETLGHFAKKMNSDEIFRNSTIDNLQELIDLIPALNIVDDPDLERVRQDIIASVGGYDPAVLRTDDTQRKVAASEADRIMSDMKGFMGAFGNNQ